MLSLFRIHLKPENSTAIDQYGEIKNVKLSKQPSSIRIDIMDSHVIGNEPFTADYPAAGFVPNTLRVNSETSLPEAISGGYVMAAPAQKFTIEAETDRLWVSAEFDFATALDPYKMSDQGTIYDVTLTFMEGYEMKVEIETAKEWWMDSVFN